MNIQENGIDCHFFNYHIENQQQEPSPLVPIVERAHGVAQTVLTEPEQKEEPSLLPEWGAVLVAGTAGQTTAIALSALSVVGKLLPPPYNLVLGGTIVVLAHFGGGVVYHKVHGHLVGPNGG